MNRTRDIKVKNHGNEVLGVDIYNNGVQLCYNGHVSRTLSWSVTGQLNL